MNINANPQMLDSTHIYTVNELTETLRVETPEFALCLWRCPYAKNEVIFEGYAKCLGGVKFLVWRYKRGVSLRRAKADLLKYGYFSARPYQLAQACDGTITSCVLALFVRFCRECGHDAEGLLSRRKAA